ncbi:MAG: TerB family tellurite resistance protein [Lachnospiraceae bacterium]|nr:TerB family tellurite resistance protein [Lachnospiraceae bacterium]
MGQFEDVLQDLVNMDTDDKVDMAVEIYAELLPEFRRLDSQHDGMAIAFALLGLAASIDGELSSEEFGFISGVFDAQDMGFDEEETLHIIRYAAKNKQDAYDLIKAAHDNMNEEDQSRLLQFIAVFSSLDDRISAEEIALIKSFW